MHDAAGHPLSGATTPGRDRLEQAFDELRCFSGNPLATADAALAEAPGLVMAHALRAYLFLLSAEAAAVPMAREALRHAQALPHDAREAAHLHAIELWCHGRWRAAARALEDLSLAHPRDALALQAGQQLDFFTGDLRLLRDRIARALPAWSPAVPGWHAVLGMMAFGLEENGDYARAEDLGRQAVALEPRDAWAQHAVVHVLEMQGRRDEGVRWMREQAGWQRDSFLGVHNHWHLALHLLGLEDTDAALRLYDEQVAAGPAPTQLDLVDASALLWRLHLRGVDVGARWAALAERWAPVEGLGFYAFSDWHAAMAFVGAGRQDLLLALARAQAQALQSDTDNAGFTREVGLAAVQAVAACGQHDFAMAVDLLRGVRSQAHRFGGSHAQRDLLDLTLLHAAQRSGQHGLARALQAERESAAASRRPAPSPVAPTAP